MVLHQFVSFENVTRVNGSFNSKSMSLDNYNTYKHGAKGGVFIVSNVNIVCLVKMYTWSNYFDCLVITEYLFTLSNAYDNYESTDSSSDFQ